MTEQSQVQWTRIVMAAAVLSTLARALFVGSPPPEQLASADNDDILRFLAVRDFLAGQGWFDTFQYRILPPEGLSLHWSRYVDVGIAGLIALSALIVPMATAEAVAIVGWPILLFSALIVISGTYGRRTLGTLAAVITVITLVIWPVTNETYFRVGRLDHHNLQIVLTTLMVLTLIVPGHHRLGWIAGLAAALSLAIGLETLPLVGVAGSVVVLRAAVIPDEAPRALSFSAALFLGCALAFAGQTHPSLWGVGRCDQLSLPWLSLVLTGFISTAALVVVSRTSRVAGVAALGGTAILGLALSAAMLSPCQAGPYANLPEDVRALIPTIIEARPAHWFLAQHQAVFFETVAPALGALVLAALAWGLRRAHGKTSANEDRALVMLLTLGFATTLGLFWQIRVLVLSAAVVPLLTGYGLAAVIEARRAAPSTATAFALFVAGAATLFEPILFRTWQSLGPQPAIASTPHAPNCRRDEALQMLSSLPPGHVFNPIDLGAPIILLTEHTVSSAPYHRSATALTNGLKTFNGDEATFRQGLRDMGADYVVVCRNATYGDEESFASQIARGAVPVGFTRLSSSSDDLIVLISTSG